MRIKWKPSFFIALLLGMLFWIGTGFFVKTQILPYDPATNFQRVTKFVSQNWITISLILSELASLLPGPWNGIVQSIIRGLNKKSRRNNSNH